MHAFDSVIYENCRILAGYDSNSNLTNLNIPVAVRATDWVKLSWLAGLA